MALIQFDHAVWLANEEARARKFYQEILGASVEKTFVRNRQGRELHRSFLSLGPSGHVIGLFEDKTAVPEPQSAREWPAVVFRMPPDRYADVTRQLSGTRVEGINRDGTETFYTFDSEGNAVGFVPQTGASEVTLLRLEFDVPRIEDAVSFYSTVFGIELGEYGFFPQGMCYAWFPVGGGEQGLMAIERPGAPGPNPGQHFAFLVSHADHTALKENLKRLGVEESEGHEGERVPGEMGTYVDDPWGHKLQWITHADTP